jgi:hypothetical protein
MNRALQRALANAAKMDARHSYSYSEDLRALVVREPENHDGGIVCVLRGDPNHEATNEQAEAICKALDKLMKERNA